MLAIPCVACAILAAWPSAAIAETVWAVGDGGTGANASDDALGAFIHSQRPDRFLYLGDVYESGTADEFRLNYQPAFGALKSISSPTPGDNEWAQRSLGYDPYWGTLAPQAAGGGHYYSFDVGGWHVISLNSNQSTSAGSTQLDWLRADLAQPAYTGTCTIAIIHEPRYFASTQSVQPDSHGLEDLWAKLQGRAVAMLSGHVHNYQRLVPERGITQYIVGTGGREDQPVPSDGARRVLGSAARTGALRVDLEPGSGRFAFFATSSSTPIDSSTLSCRPHGSTRTPSAHAPVGATATFASSSGAPGLAAAEGTQRARISLRRPRGVTRRRRLKVVGASHGARGAIRVSLVRRVGRRCRLFDGRRFRRSSCRARAMLVARGRERWSYRFSRRLPPGSYVLSARVVGAHGVIAWASCRLTVR